MTVTTSYSPGSYTPTVNEFVTIVEHWRRGDYKGADEHQAWVAEVTDTTVTASLMPPDDPFFAEFSHPYDRAVVTIMPAKEPRRRG